MADRRSAAIAIGGRAAGANVDVSILSQSLPCKPRSLAQTSPEMEPPPLELPKSSPAESILQIDEERSLIRYADADISAEEFSSTPAQREMYLSQSCPNWSTFQMPQAPAQAPARFEMPEETAEGAVAVPGHPAVENVIEAEVGIIGASPTILESFKIYNQAGSVGLLDEEMGKSSLDDINEDEPSPENDDDDEAQFSLEA